MNGAILLSSERGVKVEERGLKQGDNVDKRALSLPCKAAFKKKL